jgi:hypothetical protein
VKKKLYQLARSIPQQNLSLRGTFMSNLNSESFASIEKILFLTPVVGSSKAFEKAILSNYSQVIFEKDTFKVGDLCVFCKAGSRLPEKKEFEIFRKNNFFVRKKTIAGQISDGFCFPVSILPSKEDTDIGKDVSHLLNLTSDKFLLEIKTFAKSLIEQIQKAFSNITLGEGISLRQAREIDDYGDPETVRHLDERNDWRKVTDQDLEKYQDGIYSFCDEAGKRFYLPAYMCFRLREFVQEKNYYIFWGLLPTYSCAFNFESLLYKKKIEDLTTKQAKLLKQFIALFIAKDEKKLIELFKIIEKYPIEEDCFIKIGSKATIEKKLKFTNKPNKIRNKR